MNALAPRHRAWVIAMFEQGTADYTEAARAAGYEDTGTGAIRVAGHRLAHRADVKAAMQEEQRRRLVLMLPLADKGLKDVVSNPQHKDQLKAVSMIFNRAGIFEETSHNINLNITMTVEEKLEKIRQLAEKHHIPVDQALGTITDAEFEELPAEKAGNLADKYADEDY
jgi:hypothetical protein